MSVLLILACLPVSAAVEEEQNNTGMQSFGLPVVSITMEDPPSSITKTEQLPAVFSLLTDDGSDITNAKITIKGRGNATWNAPKKPYQIKFESKTNIFGMGKAKKWVLLANYYDQALVRFYMAVCLSNKLCFAYTPQMRFVDLYINGEYQGNYTLGEKVEVGSSRVDISDDGLLLEVNSLLDENHNFVTRNKVPFSIKEPEYDAITDDMDDEKKQQITEAVNAVKTEIQSIENKLYLHRPELFDYIDMDSFVDWYIVNELYKNIDSYFKKSCYMYRDAQGKFFMGPVWDFDLALGGTGSDNVRDPEGFHTSSQRWYRQLRIMPEFEQALRARWTQLRNDGVLDSFFSEYNEILDVISNSAEENMKVWQYRPFNDINGKTIYTRNMEIDYVRQFYAERVVWMDQMLSDDPSPVANAETLMRGLPERTVTINSGDYVRKVNHVVASLTDEERSRLDESLLEKLDGVKQRLKTLEQSPGLNDVKLSRQVVHRNGTVDFTVITSADINKIAVLNEKNSPLGKRNETVTFLDNGTVMHTFSCSFGTAGTRTITVAPAGGSEEYPSEQIRVIVIPESQPLPDKTGLSQLAEQAGSIDLDDMTSSSADALIAALQNAHEVLDDPLSLHADIANSLSVLQNAVDSLVLKPIGIISASTGKDTVQKNEPVVFSCITSPEVSKIGLFNESGNGVNRSNQTVSTLEDGNLLYTFTSSFNSSGQRNLTISALNGEFRNEHVELDLMVLNEIYRPADREGLAQLVSQAEAVDLSDKTEQSVSALNTALETAKNLLADENAAYRAVETAKAQLMDAMDNLETKPILPGDVDRNYKIDTADALLVLKMAIGIVAPDEDQTALADVNGDGAITSEDSLLILKYVVGIIKEF